MLFRSTFTCQYHASRLINLEWVQHGAGNHKLYPASCNLQDSAGHTLITAYAVHRPDGNFSLMLINKDQSNSHEVRISFEDSSHQGWSGPITMTTFGSEQYMWKSDGPNGHPQPNEPPVTSSLDAGTPSITLPKASITVVRAKIIV